MFLCVLYTIMFIIVNVWQCKNTKLKSFYTIYAKKPRFTQFHCLEEILDDVSFKNDLDSSNVSHSIIRRKETRSNDMILNRIQVGQWR